MLLEKLFLMSRLMKMLFALEWEKNRLINEIYDCIGFNAYKF